MGNKNSGNRTGNPRAAGAGRPKIYGYVRRGAVLIMERQPIAGLPQPPERLTVLSVSDDEIELQADNEDIIVLHLPDA